ncbi:hypothetical protein RvY_16382 [Ramazzottius varieornatus]|uniref:Uncharacterized protein n=1 Tax=Ramazzottius varieornatus TaxID=947166 RepID=A0A1D1W124_RAMVA|nr:hypothetical protein RvY_16382 [Ramazzottius varieornatus]
MVDSGQGTGLVLCEEATQCKYKTRQRKHTDTHHRSLQPAPAGLVPAYWSARSQMDRLLLPAGRATGTPAERQACTEEQVARHIWPLLKFLL